VSSPRGIIFAELYKELAITKFCKFLGEYENGTFCVSSKANHAVSENKECNYTTKLSQISYMC